MEYYVTKNQKKLRCGITTGTCAAAAAKAAASRLLLGMPPASVLIQTPKGITAEVPVFFSFEEENRVEYMAVKDSGDDPDVTDGVKIAVCVMYLQAWEDKEFFFQCEEAPYLFLDGGTGVGRVTGKGMEQRQGQAAINRVPRKMIFQAVREVCELAGYAEELLVRVWVPAGEELAKKTFNPRLGIEGGISILGTSGILEPMSEKAIVDTIEAQLRKQQALGKTKLLLTPGNYGQSYAQEYLGMDMADSIKCSNYIGETLDLAVVYGMTDVLLVGNIGKLVKLAAGIMNTHSKVADGRCEIFAVHTVLCGGSRELAEKIMGCMNTEEILHLLTESGLRERVCKSICGKIHEYVSRRTGSGVRTAVVLFSESFGYLGETVHTKAILQELKSERNERK